MTPLQHEILDRLVTPGERRPIADLTLADALRQQIEGSLADLAPLRSWTADAPLWLRKDALSSIHACEQYYVATLGEPFQWNAANAKGFVAHNAIRLICGGHRGNELALVKDALAVLTEHPGSAMLGEYLTGLTEGGRADLISRALPAVETFLSAWPPLGEVTVIPDYHAKALFLNRCVVVSGKVDLAFGSPRRIENGVEARRVLLELKTGGEFVAEHRQDAFLYALLETLKTRVPPFRVATWYLDSGTLVVDSVDEMALQSAARRVADGVRRIVELDDAEVEPQRRPGWRCRFCPCSSDCEVALLPPEVQSVDVGMVIRAVSRTDQGTA